MDYNTLTFFYAIWGFVGILMIIILALFLLDAFARYKYLKVRGYDKCWMAFVPLANMWATVDATYGKTDKINIYGWQAPAIILKLWAVVLFLVLVIAGRIPVIGSLICFAMEIANIAVFIQIYRDMMERLYSPQEGAEVILAVIIHFISSIKILGAAKKYDQDELDYRQEERVLRSQRMGEGMLSFMNGH